MTVKMTMCALALMIGVAQCGKADESQAAPEAGQTAQSQPDQQTPSADQQAQSQTQVQVQPDPQAGNVTLAQSATEEKEINGVKLAAIELNIITYTNQERARHGLPPLEVDKKLMESARQHAAWMTRNHSMVHTNRPVAENIAMGQPHSSDVVRAWMNSPGHRANILNLAHRAIGVAAFRTENGTIFWCQQFHQ
jgi:uncharacterized protein YkwD